MSLDPAMVNLVRFQRLCNLFRAGSQNLHFRHCGATKSGLRCVLSIRDELTGRGKEVIFKAVRDREIRRTSAGNWSG